MSVTAEALRQLHRIHHQLTDLRDRLARGPKQVAAAQQSVRTLQSEAEQLREAARKLRVQADQKQLQLAERENRIEELKRKLNTAASNREYQALREQIAADKQANSVLADEILDALGRLDEMDEKIRVAEARLAKVREDAAALEQRVSDESQSLRQQLERVQEELKRAEDALPAEFRADYRRMTKARGEHALAAVENGSCGECYQVLSTQTMNELFLSKLVFCKSCGCVLYMPEKTTVGEGSD